MKIFLVEAKTGCSCCSDDNHYRGPYKSEEEAKRRIEYYKSPDSKYWPLASQYSKRGNYSVHEIEAEEISNSRIIIEDRVHAFNGFIEVNPDGTLNSSNESEYFSTIY